MNIIKLVLLLSCPFFGVVSILLLKYYNSGLGGSLKSKRIYLIFAIIALILSILLLILYFLYPVGLDNIMWKLYNMNWFDIIINGLVGGIITKFTDLLTTKKQTSYLLK